MSAKILIVAAMLVVSAVVALFARGSKQDESPHRQPDDTDETAPVRTTEELKFAESLTNRLSELDAEADFTFDVAAFAFRFSDERTLYLGNFFADYSNCEIEDQPAMLDEIAAAALNPVPEIPDTFEAAKEHILPVVQHKSYFAFAALHSGEQNDSDQFTFPMRSFAGDLVISLVYDLPHARASLTKAQLAEWNAAESEVFNLSLANIERHLESIDAPFQELAPGLLVSTSNDPYEACRLLFPEVFQSLPVKGQYVAAAPFKHVLFVTGSEDELGLEALSKVLKDALMEPRPLSFDPMVLADDNAWHPFQLEPSHPLHNQFRQISISSAAGDYQGQAQLLAQSLEDQGEDIFIASYDVFQDASSKEVFSHATWNEGIPTLLPQTDKITLLASDSDNSADPIMVEWAAAFPLLEPHLEPTEYYPLRYKTAGFPAGEVLDKLRAMKARIDL